MKRKQSTIELLFSILLQVEWLEIKKPLKVDFITTKEGKVIVLDHAEDTVPQD